MKKDRVISFIFGMFLAAGCVLLIIGAALGVSNYKFVKNAEEVSVTVDRIEGHRTANGDYVHDVYVNYSFNGEDYNSVRIGEYDSGMYEGKEFSMYCRKTNPTDLKSKFSVYFATGILTVLGLIFVLVSLIPRHIINKNKKRAQKLKSEGMLLRAVIDRVETDESVSVNSEHPYVLYCSCRDECKNLIYRFKSRPFWEDPSSVLEKGMSIDVYVNHNDYSKYYVDVEAELKDRVIDYT